MQGGTQLRLVMRRGPQVDRAFPILKDVVMIGRDAANDIIIADPEVSRHHSRIVQQPNGMLTIEDLGSTNGTYVNGARLVSSQALTPGDTIGLGETVVLQFQAAAGDAGTTVAAPRSTYQGEAAPAPYTPEPGFAPAPSYPPPAQVYQPASVQAPPQAAVPRAPLPQTGSLRAAPPRRSANTRNYLLAGCGCLLLLCVLCVVAVWVGDTFGGAAFWTVPPMSWILDLVRALGLESMLGAG
jgi:predicted component of type VI protein secretion system